MLSALLLAIVLAQPLPLARLDADLCSRVEASVSRAGHEWSLPEEEDEDTKYPQVFVGETPTFVSTVMVSPEDLKRLGGRDAISRVSVAFRGPNGAVLLPMGEEAGRGRTCDSVRFRRRHQVRELPPPGMYDLAIRVPGCGWRSLGANGRYVIRNPASGRESGYVALRNLDAVGGVPPRDMAVFKRSLGTVLESELPVETVIAAAATFLVPNLRSGAIAAPDRMYCVRAREYLAKHPESKGENFEAWEQACDTLEKGGPWQFPLNRLPETNTRAKASLEDVMGSAVVAYQEDRLDEAERGFRKALEASGADAEANMGLGRVLLAREVRGAAEYLRKGVSARPEDVSARYCLANALWAEGKQDEAIAEYRAVVAKGGRSEVGERAFQMLKKMGKMSSIVEESEEWRNLLRRYGGPEEAAGR